MKLVSRRNFLLASLGSYISFSFLSNKCNMGLFPHSINNDEFSKFYNYWQKKYSVTPEQKIKELGMREGKSILIVENLIQEEFSKGKTFDYKGLILSETEAATFALIGLNLI